MEILLIASVENGGSLECSSLIPMKLTNLPKNGKMVSGKIYEIVRQHPTAGKGSGLWPTPTANDAKNSLTQSQAGRGTLTARLVEIMFPTPVASGKLNGGTRDFQHLHDMAKAGQITEEERRSMSAGNGGKLNPAWVEWLMGYPIGWTDLDVSEIQLSLKLQK